MKGSGVQGLGGSQTDATWGSYLQAAYGLIAGMGLMIG